MDRFTKIIKPKKIFMGEKDFQQLYLVKKYIERKYKSRVIACKTIRDKNKLALSSRNALLNKNELSIARNLSNTIYTIKNKLNKIKDKKKFLLIKKNEIKKTYNTSIEYLELRNINTLQITNNIKKSKLFIAYYLNKIRLIDNF